MTVQELIDMLTKLPNKDRIVVQSIDSEGNSIRNTAEVSEGAFEQDSSWDGELRLEELTDELIDLGFGPEDVGSEEAKPCVCFWPVN